MMIREKTVRSKLNIWNLAQRENIKIGTLFPMTFRIYFPTNYIVKKAEITCEIIKILGKLGDPQALKGKYNSPNSTVLCDLSEML